MAEAPPDTLPFILYGRIVGAATAAMQRSDQYNNSNSQWHYAARSDGWRPEFTDDTTITYYRAHHEGAKIVARNIQLTPQTKIEYSNPVIIPSNPHRTIQKVRVPAGQSTKVTIREKTIDTATLNESAEVGLKLTLEAHFGYVSGTASGGPQGGGSVTAEASAKYTRQWGISGTVEKEQTVELPITGPFFGSVELVRDISDVSTTVYCTPDFEFQVECWEGGTKLYSWESYAVLLSVLEGAAPVNRDLAAKFAYDPVNLVNQNLSEARIRSFGSRKIPQIHYTTKYNNVSNIQINYLPDKSSRELPNE